MTLELGPATARAWLIERGLADADSTLELTELTGGVSATVLAVHGARVPLVLKQALPRLRVADVWEAKLERTNTEVAALRLYDRLVPGSVPKVIDHDPDAAIVAIELLPASSRNWQAEIAAGRVHVDAATWAGSTLGIWHRETGGSVEIAAQFDDDESFDQQRLEPFYRRLADRLPDLAPAILAHHDELRDVKACLVDGDFAMKNVHVGPGGPWAFDCEVAHYGNPLFDLGFFLSFVVLSALRWPALAPELAAVRDRFLAAYRSEAHHADDDASVTGHTACLILARTDGTSPAQFLDDVSRDRARTLGRELLAEPERGLTIVSL